MKFKVLAFILIAFSINLYADEYKFDYAVIDNEKVTTVSASNITAHLISESKATVTYKNETVTLISKDGYEYKGFIESLCISIVAVPYSRSYVFDTVSHGSLPAFLTITNGL